jgi:superfamily II DNA helicase RecQ
MVLYNSFNLRTVEPDITAVVTSTNCRRLAMLNAFLRESDLQQVPNKTHKCCDICANKCSCGNCTFLPLETLFCSNKLKKVILMPQSRMICQTRRVETNMMDHSSAL